MSGLAELKQIPTELKKEGLLEFDRQTVIEDHPANRHVLIVWIESKTLSPIHIRNKDIDDIVNNTAAQTSMKWNLRHEIWRRLHEEI
jgi:hypothetical protein